ncbi:BQ5605_C017g08399 [Microbotryum silenes-dioicae]|uniref:BQ5605_C017g08399 protein n=1 Tax=Microbotryum silenes-dioicae TaxID=796604 RepID=A0A2X0MGC3_9BASI|nr:BQ5605_C017g08399 [Microbotryum silenes-dioicae]
MTYCEIVKVPKTRTGSQVSDTQEQSGVVGSSIIRDNIAKGVEAQEVQDEEDTSDGLDDINLLDLADMGSDGPHHRGGAGLKLGSDHLYTGSEFDQEWKSHERSSFLCQGQRQAEWSTLTVKAPPMKTTAQNKGRVRLSTMAALSSGLLASLPTSWLEQQRKQVGLGPLIKNWVQEGQGEGMSERLDGPGSEIVSENMIPAEPQVRVEPQEQAETSGGEVFHSTIQGHAQDFVSARSSDLLPTSSSSLILIAQPHRFTLVKPGFQKVLAALLTYGQAPPPTIEPSKPTKLLAFASGSKPKQSLRPQTTNLRSSPMVGEDKCAYCEKNFGTFGWRAYLECDDCTIKCHIKCSDEMDLDCHQHQSLTPAQTVTSSALSRNPRTLLSPLNGGGPKGKLSSARTKWTE